MQRQLLLGVAWGGYARCLALKPGEIVRFYADLEMKGQFVDVVIDAIEPIDLACCSETKLEAWSAAKGWTKVSGACRPPCA